MGAYLLALTCGIAMHRLAFCRTAHSASTLKAQRRARYGYRGAAPESSAASLSHSFSVAARPKGAESSGTSPVRWIPKAQRAQEHLCFTPSQPQPALKAQRVQQHLRPAGKRRNTSRPPIHPPVVVVRVLLKVLKPIGTAVPFSVGGI